MSTNITVQILNRQFYLNIEFVTCNDRNVNLSISLLHLLTQYANIYHVSSF